MTGCPKRDLPEDVWDVIEMTGLFYHGIPPIAGGVLDQARCFVDAARYVRSCQAEHGGGTLDDLFNS